MSFSGNCLQVTSRDVTGPEATYGFSPDLTDFWVTFDWEAPASLAAYTTDVTFADKFVKLNGISNSEGEFSVADLGGGDIHLVTWNADLDLGAFVADTAYHVEIHFNGGVSIDYYVNGSLVQSIDDSANPGDSCSGVSYGLLDSSANDSRETYWIDTFKIGTSREASDIFEDDFETTIPATPPYDATPSNPNGNSFELVDGPGGGSSSPCSDWNLLIESWINDVPSASVVHAFSGDPRFATLFVGAFDPEDQNFYDLKNITIGSTLGGNDIWNPAIADTLVPPFDSEVGAGSGLSVAGGVITLDDPAGDEDYGLHAFTPAVQDLYISIDVKMTSAMVGSGSPSSTFIGVLDPTGTEITGLYMDFESNWATDFVADSIFGAVPADTFVNLKLHLKTSCLGGQVGMFDGAAAFHAER